MALFDAVDIIRVKRDGGVLTPDQIDWTIDAYTKGVIKDEQMAALAMAIFLRGMDRGEIARWTDAMIRSGARMDFSGIGKPTADKHSTGGVGDKITLPLAPLVACFGVAVPQLSGRGLGHTGGTLDKLEAIPGWRAQLSNDEIMTQLGQGCGAVICAAGSGLAPADKKLYALRDITSTVESIALIASSIMSKKIAEGTGALVLDVKVGSGAFMKDLDAARELAGQLDDVGGPASGEDLNGFLHLEGVADLAPQRHGHVGEEGSRGNPRVASEVDHRAGELARNMLDLAGMRDADVEAALADGRAMDRWRAMIREQGGDPDAPLPRAAHTHQVLAEAGGTVVGMDALSVGVASWRLGAGRAVKEDPVQAGAGIEIHAKPGERVEAGQPLLTLHTDDEWRIERALESLSGAIEIADGVTPEPRSVVLETVS